MSHVICIFVDEKQTEGKNISLNRKNSKIKFGSLVRLQINHDELGKKNSIGIIVGLTPANRDKTSLGRWLLGECVVSFSGFKHAVSMNFAENYFEVISS